MVKVAGGLWGREPEQGGCSQGWGGGRHPISGYQSWQRTNTWPGQH